MNREVIGRILCINADGGVQFTVNYGIPHVLRDSELFTEFGIFYQNHQLPDGQWVYKYLRPLAGRPSDQDLSDYRHPADANWDGPVPAKKMATWDHVNALFGKFIREGCNQIDLIGLQALAYAAFHKYHVPDPPEPLEQAIPEAINIDLADAPVDPPTVIE